MTEKFVRYSTEVKELSAAWAFVMNHVDEFTRPTINIESITSYSVEDLNYGDTVGTESFTVSVSGITE